MRLDENQIDLRTFGNVSDDFLWLGDLYFIAVWNCFNNLWRKVVNWKPGIEFTSWDIGSREWCQVFRSEQAAVSPRACETDASWAFLVFLGSCFCWPWRLAVCRASVLTCYVVWRLERKEGVWRALRGQGETSFLWVWHSGVVVSLRRHERTWRPRVA